jgi:adenylate cyclase
LPVVQSCRFEINTQTAKLQGLAVPPTLLATGNATERCRKRTACGMIAGNVDNLNELLAHDLPDPIRFGIGIHAGPAIVGDIDYEQYVTFTVIGDAVNVASRLQDLTKSYGCEVLISEEVYEQAGFGPDDLPHQEVEARGRVTGVRARRAVRASDLGPLLVTR